MSPKHKCQICGREVDDSVGLAHIKAQEEKYVSWTF